MAEEVRNEQQRNQSISNENRSSYSIFQSPLLSEERIANSCLSSSSSIFQQLFKLFLFDFSVAINTFWHKTKFRHLHKLRYGFFSTCWSSHFCCQVCIKFSFRISVTFSITNIFEYNNFSFDYEYKISIRISFMVSHEIFLKRTIDNMPSSHWILLKRTVYV